MNLAMRSLFLVVSSLLLLNSPAFATTIRNKELDLMDINALKKLKIKDEIKKNTSDSLHPRQVLARVKVLDPFAFIIRPEENVFDGKVPVDKVTMTKIVQVPTGKTTFKSVIDPKTGKPKLETSTRLQLRWSDALMEIRLFLRIFAPDSDSLKKAWFEVNSADFMISVFLASIKDKEAEWDDYKVLFFSSFIEPLKLMRESLDKEIKTVGDVKMWFSDTQAAKDVMLATIPRVIKVIDRITGDYEKLKERVAKESKMVADLKEQERIERESSPVYQLILDAYNKRNVGPDEKMLETGGFLFRGPAGSESNKTPEEIQPSWKLPLDYNMTPEMIKKMEEHREKVKLLVLQKDLASMANKNPEQKAELDRLIEKRINMKWPEGKEKENLMTLLNMRKERVEDRLKDLAKLKEPSDLEQQELLGLKEELVKLNAELTALK